MNFYELLKKEQPQSPMFVKKEPEWVKTAKEKTKTNSSTAPKEQKKEPEYDEFLEGLNFYSQKTETPKSKTTVSVPKRQAYSQFAPKEQGIMFSKSAAEEYDDFVKAFNDPYGEKEEGAKRREKFANIRANADKRNWDDDFLIGLDDPYGEKEAERREKFANIRANVDKRDWNSQNTSALLLDRSNEVLTGSEQKVKFPNTEIHTKPLMFPNTQLQAKPQDDKAFKDLYGEKERWEEEITSNPNDFQPNVLGIAPMGREGSMWCWIAAASMVDEYYHPENSASQEEISAQLGKGRRDGGYIEETSELEKGSRSCTTSGFSDRISANELTYEKIQEEMQGKHPIVLLTKTGDKYESEHYVVIVGCYTNGQGERYVIVNETREDTTKKEKPGLQTHIPYEQLKEVFSTGRGANQRIKAFYTTRPEKDSYHK